MVRRDIRCASCGAFNTIDADVRITNLSELVGGGRVERPVRQSPTGKPKEQGDVKSGGGESH